MQKYLQSNTTGAEITNTEGVTDFDDNGLLKIGTDAFLNESGTTMVIWNWKANGSPVINTAGTITSQVSANTDAGFSIVTYTGSVSGSPSTIGHGLGKTPRMIIVKPRSATGNWAVYHEDLNPGSSYNHAIFLNLINAKSSANNAYWGGNTMTLNNNLFSVNNSTETNTNSVTYVAYCFAEIEGYSKFGSYTGNGSADGTFVYLGFRPAFVLFKVTSTTENWTIFDNTRDEFNYVRRRIHPSASDAENVGNDSVGNIAMDFVSNGFKIITASTNINGSGQTYIYMAFAENPFKYSTAR